MLEEPQRRLVATKADVFPGKRGHSSDRPITLKLDLPCL